MITNEVLNTIYEFPELGVADSAEVCEGGLFAASLKTKGAPPYIFEWQHGPFDSLNHSGVHTIPILNTQNYLVKVTDSLGFKDSAVVFIQTTPNPDVSFVFTQQTIQVEFRANAYPNLFWYWDFGDGGRDTGHVVNHTFGGFGVFRVRLVSGNTCGTDTAYRDIEIHGLGIANDNSLINLKWVPHPLEDVSFLTFDNPEHRAFQLQIYDLQGKLVRSIGPSRDAFFEFKRGNLPSGVYLYELKGEVSYYGRLMVSG